MTTDTAGYELTRMSPTERPLGEAPPQYGTGERCVECKRPLSTYNPYVVCGPCRMRLSRVMPEDNPPKGEHGVEPSFVWERFARRTAVRSGPLLAETVRAE